MHVYITYGGYGGCYLCTLYSSLPHFCFFVLMKECSISRMKHIKKS